MYDKEDVTRPPDDGPRPLSRPPPRPATYVNTATADWHSADLSTKSLPAEFPYVIVAAGVVSFMLSSLLCWCLYNWYSNKRAGGSSSGADFAKKLLAGLDHVAPSWNISQSTPDITHDCRHNETDTARRVIRQTTLPSVSERHQDFQRQLSQKLDTEFTVCSLQKKAQPQLGEIQPELYPEQEGSQCSVDVSEVIVGHLKVRLTLKTPDLLVTVVRAWDLPAKEFSGTCDPYVKCFLLPDRKKKFQTKVLRRTQSPEFNETFQFGPLDDVESMKGRVLQLYLFDFDRFSRHDLVGQAQVDIGQINWAAQNNDYDLCLDVISPPNRNLDLGDILISLTYLPTAGRLTITIIKARALKAMDVTGSSDPYVKVSLMYRGRRIKKRKTSVKRNCLSPVYNEALTFDVPQENIEDVSLLIQVIDYDRLGSNEFMGCCATGLHQGTWAGREHWWQMMENVRKPVAQWYSLQEHVPEGVGAPQHHGDLGSVTSKLTGCIKSCDAVSPS